MHSTDNFNVWELFCLWTWFMLIRNVITVGLTVHKLSGIQINMSQYIQYLFRTQCVMYWVCDLSSHSSFVSKLATLPGCICLFLYLFFNFFLSYFYVIFSLAWFRLLKQDYPVLTCYWSEWSVPLKRTMLWWKMNWPLLHFRCRLANILTILF